jgi:hypothetical protein
LFLSAALCSGLVQAQELAATGVQRLCLLQDLENHTFKRMEFVQTPPRGESNLAIMFPHDYIAFQQGYTYTARASNIEIPTKAKAEEILRPPPNNPKRFTLSQDGVLNLIVHDKIKSSFRCVAVLKSAGKYIPGDIILNGYTRKGKSQIYKFYRRWY